MAQGIKPLQAIPQSQKAKKNDNGDSEWGVANIDYYIECSDFAIRDGQKEQILKNYQIYNNDIPEKWFHYVTNPLNSEKEKYKNFPAKIRPYNIIRPNVDMYMGEFIKRAFTFMVLNLAENAYNTHQEQLTKATYDNCFQRYINELNDLGVDTGQDSQEVVLPQKLEEAFNKKYQDIRALKGQQRLEALEREKDFFRTFKKLFLDYIIAGACYTYKNVERGDLVYERVSPLDLDYGIAPDKDYVEDADWWVRRKICSPADIVDKFYDKLEKKHHDYLDKESDNRFTNKEDFFNRLTGEEDNISDTVTLYHVVWKGKKKTGFFSYRDEMGEYQEEIVEEGFKIPEEIKAIPEMEAKVKWVYTNALYEGYRVDDEFYFDIRELPIQRNSLNNFSYCKGPYNGFKFSATHATNTSIVELGVPYQTLFIIINYHIEKTIAKSKGKIALVDYNVIPDGDDWDEEKFFYYGEALGWALIDRNKIGVDKSFNQYQVLDFSLSQHISQLIAIKEDIKKDFDELLGITRQRKGQTQGSDTMGGNERATFQSSIMSELMFGNFDDFRSNEYQGIMDYAKFLYLEGKKGLYYGDDLSATAYSIDGGDILESELAIKVTTSGKDISDLNNFKQFAHAFAQNGSKPTTVLDVIKSTSIIGLENKLAAAEKVTAEETQQQGQQDSKNAQELEQMKSDLAKDLEVFRNDLKIDYMEKEADRLDNREVIKGDIELEKLGMEDSNADNTPDILDVESRNIERMKANNDKEKNLSEAGLKNKELDIKAKEAMIKADTEKYKADTSLKVAKENKNKYDA
jgi:hypothetical protein